MLNFLLALWLINNYFYDQPFKNYVDLTLGQIGPYLILTLGVGGGSSLGYIFLRGNIPSIKEYPANCRSQGFLGQDSPQRPQNLLDCRKQEKTCHPELPQAKFLSTWHTQFHQRYRQSPARRAFRNKVLPHYLGLPVRNPLAR